MQHYFHMQLHIVEVEIFSITYTQKRDTHNYTLHEHLN